MAGLYVFLVILGLAAILGLYFLTPSRRARTGRSPAKDFEIIGWNGHPAEPINDLRKKKSSADFTSGLRWQNPDALCLLTGVRAADCDCETHRSPG